VWVADLNSGHSEPLAPGLPVLDYDISPDSRQVVLEALDADGKPRLWLTPIDRRSPPQQIAGVEGRNAHFGPSGDIFFRHTEGFSSFLYRVRMDGTGLRKALEQPVLYSGNVSPDGRWIRVWPGCRARGRPPYRCFRLTVVHRLSSEATPFWSGRAVETRCGSPPGRFPTAGVTLFHSCRARSCRRFRREDSVPRSKSPVCRERAGSTSRALPARLATSTLSSAAPSSGISIAFRFPKGPRADAAALATPRGPPS